MTLRTQVMSTNVMVPRDLGRTSSRAEPQGVGAERAARFRRGRHAEGGRLRSPSRLSCSRSYHRRSRMTLSSHPRQTVGREPSLDERHNSRTVGRCGHSVDTRGSRDSPMGSRALYQSHRTHTRNRHRTLGRSDRAHPAPQLTTSRTNRTQAALPPSPFSYRLPSMTCDILLSPPTLRESGTIIGIAYITADVHALVSVCAGTDRLKAGIPGPPSRPSHGSQNTHPSSRPTTVQ